MEVHTSFQYIQALGIAWLEVAGRSHASAECSAIKQFGARIGIAAFIRNTPLWPQTLVFVREEITHKWGKTVLKRYASATSQSLAA